PGAPAGPGAPPPRPAPSAAAGASAPRRGAASGRPGPPYRLWDATLRPLAPAPRLGADPPAWPEERGVAGAPPGPAGGRPLAGLRIVDFTAFWAGPFATQYLAAM